jgi:hypothetical protein
MDASGRSTLSRVLLTLFVVLLAALPPLAHASSPDPFWIPGVYDGADYDDIVALITSETGTPSPVAVGDLQPVLEVIGSLPLSPERATPILSASAVLPRGPPSF